MMDSSPCSSSASRPYLKRPGFKPLRFLLLPKGAIFLELLSPPTYAGVVDAHDGDNWREEVAEMQTDDAVS